MKVGNLVKVVNNGRTYSTHEGLFHRLGLRNKVVNAGFKDGTVARVFAATGEILALVDTEGNECVIHAEGVKRLSFERKKAELVRSFPLKFELVGDKLAFSIPDLTKDVEEELISQLKG